MSINQVVEQDIKNAWGFTISELVTSVSKNLETKLNHKADMSSNYTKARHLFLKNFLDKILTESYGNISHAARKAKIDRKLLRVLIKKHGLSAQRYKKRFLKPIYAKQILIEDEIKNAVKSYEGIIHQDKINTLYERLPEISAHVAEQIEPVEMTWKEAQMRFDTEYLSHALAANLGNVEHTAQKIGVNLRTLYRKIKQQNIKPVLSSIIDSAVEQKAIA